MLRDPLAYIKAIPIEGALAALGKGGAITAASTAECTAQEPTELHAACKTLTDTGSAPSHGKFWHFDRSLTAPDHSALAGLAGALPCSSCSLGTSESPREVVPSPPSEPHGRPDFTASTENSPLLGQQEVCSNSVAAELQGRPSELVHGRHPCSWGRYGSLTQPTHRRRAVSSFDPT